MSIEVLPLGMRCAKKCAMCYQEPVRAGGNTGDEPYDMAAMKYALKREGYAFTVFGGEPLLMPDGDLEELFRWGEEQFGEAARRDGRSPNGVQTDGYLITDRHIAMFKRYGVGVGISCDGPGELNDIRAMRGGGLEATRQATARTLAAIDKLLAAGAVPSLITTLNRANASAGRLPRLIDWYRELAAKGIRHVNLHMMEVDNPGVREQWSITEDEAVEAMMACARLQAETPMSFLPLTDMLRLLRGEDQWGVDNKDAPSCTWNACDPYTTEAVRGVDGQGNRRNCGRTYKGGVQMQKADRPGYERYLALYYAPQEYGGCSGCRFFFACKGHCPGEGEHGDWRGKTEHCGVLMRVYAALEALLVARGEEPFSLSDERPGAERAMLEAWARGGRAGVTAARAAAKQPPNQLNSSTGDQPHLDVPHGDDHGDHTDAALARRREEERQLWAQAN